MAMDKDLGFGRLTIRFHGRHDTLSMTIHWMLEEFMQAYKQTGGSRRQLIEILRRDWAFNDLANFKMALIQNGESEIKANILVHMTRVMLLELQLRLVWRSMMYHPTARLTISNAEEEKQAQERFRQQHPSSPYYSNISIANNRLTAAITAFQREIQCAHNMNCSPTIH
jgi:hypothetical protein